MYRIKCMRCGRELTSKWGKITRHGASCYLKHLAETPRKWDPNEVRRLAREVLAR